jgi:hypothetical protein
MQGRAPTARNPVLTPGTGGASVRAISPYSLMGRRRAPLTEVDEQGNGTTTEPRLYQLIRQRTSISDRRFEIAFLNTGVRAFARRFRNSGSVAEFTTLQRPTHYRQDSDRWGDLHFLENYWR